MDKPLLKDNSSTALSDELFTVSEVAAILKLTEQTVRNWIDAGRIPALRIGRRVRIRRQILQGILTDGLRPGPPPATSSKRAQL